MNAAEYFQDAFKEQSAGNILGACDLWKNFFLSDRVRDANESIAVANYMFCLSHLGLTTETVAFTERYFRSVSWFDSDLPPTLDREFANEEATPAKIVASLQTFGAALVRGHYDTRSIRDLAARTIEIRDGAGKRLYDHFSREEVAWLISPLVSEVMSAGKFNTLPEHGPSWIRAVIPREPETSVPFHQDLKAFSRRCINTWVPLTHAGKSAPGLELLPVFVEGLLPARGKSSSHYALHGLEIAVDDISAAFPGAAMWQPVMEPGDFLMFLGSTVHRTHLTADMRRTRRSLELRFLSL